MKLSLQTFIVFCASILIILELIQILTNGIETDVVWTRYKDREISCHIWRIRCHNQYVRAADLQISDEFKVQPTIAVIVWL
jgi:hypothetical protein